jgi:CRP-like cAMP-binding protein
MNTVTPVIQSDGVIGPSAEMGAVFNQPRGYNHSSAGSFRISSAASFRNKRTGPSPAAIREAAEEIDRAESRRGQERRNTLDAKATPLNWHSIHPHGKFRQRWDIFNVVLILYSSLVIPFRLGFAYTPQFALLVLDYMVDGCFGIDIVFNFCTGLEMKDKSITYDKKKIFMAYITGWFWIDFISFFPWEVFAASQDRQESTLPQLFKILRLPRLLRLLRMFRLLRVVRILNRLEYALSIQEGFRQLAFFLLTLVLLTHWFSCLFYYLGDVNRDNDNYWAVASAGDLHTSSLTKNYIAACVWSIMTLTTVGYGDISARNDGQRVLSILAMITGALFFAYGVSHIVSIVDEVRAETKKFKVQMDKFNSYMAARNLPDQLRGDIREFLHNIRKRQRASIRDEEALLGQLSMGLRSRVAMAINDQYLREMPFFLGADMNLTQELALNMESVFYSAYEDVMREGEEGDAMYFIVAGSVEILVGKALNRVAVLVEKQYFGEAALLMPEGNRKRTATVRTLVFSEFRLLRSEEFVRILADYPDTRQQIEKLAESRMQVLKRKSLSSSREAGGGKPKPSRMQSKVRKLSCICVKSPGCFL